MTKRRSHARCRRHAANRRPVRGAGGGSGGRHLRRLQRLVGNVTATLPGPRPGKTWFRVGDTAPWMESRGNFTDPGQEDALDGATYVLAGRSLLLLLER